MATFTLAHYYDDDWKLVADQMTAAFALMDRRCGKLFEKFGCIGKLKAAEAPVGRNGLHLHFHVLYTHDKMPKKDLEPFSAALCAAWGKAVAEVGGRVNKHGFDFRAGALTDYVAKVYAAHELSSQSTKKARKAGRVLGQLLDAAGKGDKKAGAEWLRGIEALRSVTRFTAGRMPGKLGIPNPSAWKDEDPWNMELDDDEPVEPAEPVVIKYSIDDHIKATNPTLGRPGLALILRAAERGGEDSVRRMVSALCADYDKRMKPFWMRSNAPPEQSEPWAFEPPDPDIIETAYTRPLSKDEVSQYLRFKSMDASGTVIRSRVGRQDDPEGLPLTAHRKNKLEVAGEGGVTASPDAELLAV